MGEKGKKRIATLGSISLFGLLGFVFFFQQNFQTIQVSGESMEPTFASGQKLLATKAYWLVGPIMSNDVIVVEGEDSGTYIIKRVYKVSGETVDWLNVPETYNIANGEYVVPSDSVFVLGDNRAVSEDSRKFGSVPVDKILGKIVVKSWL
jgi:signal peptidase I